MRRKTRDTPVSAQGSPPPAILNVTESDLVEALPAEVAPRARPDWLHLGIGWGIGLIGGGLATGAVAAYLSNRWVALGLLIACVVCAAVAMAFRSVLSVLVGFTIGMALLVAIDHTQHPERTGPTIALVLLTAVVCLVAAGWHTPEPTEPELVALLRERGRFTLGKVADLPEGRVSSCTVAFIDDTGALARVQLDVAAKSGTEPRLGDPVAVWHLIDHADSALVQYNRDWAEARLAGTSQSIETQERREKEAAARREAWLSHVDEAPSDAGQASADGGQASTGGGPAGPSGPGSAPLAPALRPLQAQAPAGAQASQPPFPAPVKSQLPTPGQSQATADSTFADGGTAQRRRRRRELRELGITTPVSAQPQRMDAAAERLRAAAAVDAGRREGRHTGEIPIPLAAARRMQQTGEIPKTTAVVEPPEGAASMADSLTADTGEIPVVKPDAPA